jgi:hypothetical protein
MKTIRLIREEIDKAMTENIKARETCNARGAIGASMNFGAAAVEDNNILSAIDKIVEKRKCEIRNTIVMAVLGAGVAALALYLMFYV